jgi:hypothetical protein
LIIFLAHPLCIPHAHFGFTLSPISYQRLGAIIALTISNIMITHINKTGGPSGITWPRVRQNKLQNRLGMCDLYHARVRQTCDNDSSKSMWEAGNRIRSPFNWKGEMQADKSLLEHMTNAMADFATRAKKTAKKVNRTMAGRPPKIAKASAGRKAVGTHIRAKKVAKKR